MIVRAVITTAFIVTALAASGGCDLHPGEAWNRSDGDAVFGGAPGGAVTSSGEDASDQSKGLCPASSPLLQGTKAAGDVCSSPADCVSTCCDCGTGSASWLSASCVAGRCVESLTSCSRTQSRYCTGGAVVIVPAPAPTSACSTGAETSACDACIDATCCAEEIACANDASCSALESCDAACAGDPACRQRCYETSSTGALTLQSLDSCVATSCGATCEP